MVEKNIASTERIFKFLASTFAQEQEMGALSAKNFNPRKSVEYIDRCVMEAAWLAEEDGEPVGSIAVVETSPWYGDQRYYADGFFYVRSDKRASTVAVDLLNAAKAYAKERNKPLIVGLFNMDNIERKAVFLKRKGFRMAGGLFITGE